MKAKLANNSEQREKRLEVLFLIGVLLFYFLWSCTQRFNFSADESMRYQLAQYLYEYGRLPHGGDPAIRNADWGISYAFYPLLSYIGSAFFMKITSFFTVNETALLIAARFMNVLLGVGSAWIVRKIAKQLFPTKYGWVFTFLVVFLPGNVILYSYVNCDALGLFSSVIIFYAWVLAAKYGWSIKNCVILSVGMGLCLMSYYNAYGYVLISFFYYIVTVLLREKREIRWKVLFTKGIFITLIVCAIALWWFVRNYIIYDGDILATNITTEYSEMYAKWRFKPSNRVTFQEQGRSMFETMFYHADFLEHDWITTVLFSFVGAFGYNKIFLSKMISIPYLLCLFAAFLFLIIYREDLFYLKKNFYQETKWINNKKVKIKTITSSEEWKAKGLLSWAMVAAIIVPNILNVYYSWASDFQAQGRYSMPMLFPLMYFVTEGCRRFFAAHKKLVKLEKYFCWLVCIFAFAMAAFSWGRIIYPLYLQNYSGLH